jgi:hypothetical protein
MTFWGYGYATGIQRGRELEDADVARLHALAYKAVQSNARLDPHEQHQAAVRARRVASCEEQKQDRVAWPEETAPKNPRPWPPMRYLRFQSGRP